MDWMTTGENERQNWLAERRKGIGSSDAPVIMGVSPWNTMFKLWMDKTGQIAKEDEFKGNWATERGNRLEPEVRKWYNEKFHCEMKPENMVHPEDPRWRCSLDGRDAKLNKIIEIKAPGREDHEWALRGEVPLKYWPQCQWLLMVSGAESLDYVSFNDNYAVVNVLPDTEYQLLMLNRAKEFWVYVETMTPPPSTEIVIDDPYCMGLLAEYDAISEQLKRIEARKSELLDQIKEYVDAGSAKCAGFKLSWVERKGTVDYSAVPELVGLNLDQYRKKPSVFLTVKKMSTKSAT